MNGIEEILFKKIWGNLYLRNEIMFHVKLLNIHNKGGKVSFSYDELKKYKYRNYINDLELNNNECEVFGDMKKLVIDKDFILPSTVTKLGFGHFYSIEIKDGCLPIGLTQVSFLEDVHQVLTSSVIGDNITSLIFYGNFNQSLAGWLPKSLTSLYFDNGFNHDISVGDLPDTLTSLILPSNYSGTINELSIPKSVTTLNFKFNSNGNKLLLSENPIPGWVTSLSFDDMFNQPISIGSLSKNITTIKFNRNSIFNGTIQIGSLPESLTCLQFSNSYMIELISGVLPSNLKYLKLGYHYNHSLMNTNAIDIFPLSMESIDFGQMYSNPLPTNYFKDHLYLTTLVFGYSFNPALTVGSLPSTLTSLDLGGYNIPLTVNCLPSSVTSLTMTDYNTPLLQGHLPPSLQTLSLYLYNQPLSINCLPNSITNLEFGYSFNQPIANSILPTSLKTLHLTNPNYNHDLSHIDFPSSLQTIYVNLIGLKRTLNSFNFLNSFNSNFFTNHIKQRIYKNDDDEDE